MRPWSIAAILLLTALAAYAQNTEYSAAVLADHPLAYYRLDESSGTSAHDFSGNGRDAIYRNGVGLRIPGALESADTAAAFDGRDDYIQVPGPWGGAGWREVTIEAWVNVIATSNDIQAIVISPDAGQFVHFQMSNAVFTYFNVIYPDILLPVIPESPLFQWRHVVLVGKSGESRIYVNGQLMGPGGPGFPPVTITDPITQIAQASEVRIGGNYFGAFGSGRFFHGNIDEVAIYDHALSQSRVLAHYNARRDALIKTCSPDANSLCLNADRFKVSAQWRDFEGHVGNGVAVPLTSDTGYFWFFNSANAELMIKVLDGRSINNRFWVFYGALSNVEYTITVVDTQTGAVRTYFNPSGTFASRGDTGAFQ
jgi:hypothetical protein